MEIELLSVGRFGVELSVVGLVEIFVVEVSVGLVERLGAEVVVGLTSFKRSGSNCFSYFNFYFTTS